jgi:hypothetical protein
MSSRRQFLGTLGRIMGGGLLLPIAGKGALSLTDTAKAAELPVRLTPLPFSPDCLELRRIRRVLADIVPTHQPQPPDCAWWRTMVHKHRPVARRMASKPATSWTDCVELAELVWSYHEKERSCGPDHGAYTGRLMTKRHWSDDAVAALVEGVLTLGNGERFDPRMQR